MKIRIARPTNNLELIKKFYQDGLGLELMSSFSGHEGFDGIMLGLKGHPYHLEFTYEAGHDVPRSPTKDHLLVFYYPELEGYKSAIQRMLDRGFEPVSSYNPYWDKDGQTFEDFEGYRVVIFHGDWPY